MHVFAQINHTKANIQYMCIWRKVLVSCLFYASICLCCLPRTASRCVIPEFVFASGEIMSGLGSPARN